MQAVSFVCPVLATSMTPSNSPGHAGRHLPTPVRVNATRSLQWLRAGFGSFVRHPIPWLVAGLLSFIVLLCASTLAAVLAPAVPMFSPMLPVVCLVLIVASLLRAADHQREGQGPRFSDLIDGVRPHGAHLALLGVFFSLPLVLLAMLGLLALGGSLLAGLLGTALGNAVESVASGLAAFFAYVITSLLVFVVCWALLLLCLFFAPALVLFNHAPPLDAMRLSFSASLRNLPAMLLFALLLSVLFALAVAPAGLGVLILIPVFAGALYQAYRDIFCQPAEPVTEEH